MGIIDMHSWDTRSDRAVYLVWLEGETEDDARLVRSHSPDRAVEDWAYWDDIQGDYSIVRGNDATVWVKAEVPADSVAVRYVVSGESVPSYTARRSPPGGVER